MRGFLSLLNFQRLFIPERKQLLLPFPFTDLLKTSKAAKHDLIDAGPLTYPTLNSSCAHIVDATEPVRDRCPPAYSEKIGSRGFVFQKTGQPETHHVTNGLEPWQYTPPCDIFKIV